MNQEQKAEVVYLYLDDIIPNRFQPREVFDEKALKELAVSIKEHGVIQPIIVRKVNDKYEIIAGERRYKASALAGLTRIPAIIRDLDDKESSKIALLENLQRKNLNPIEEARTYQKILELDQMTQDDLAKTLGKSQPAIANKLRLLSLPDEVQSALLKEEISERHARALLNVTDNNKQKELLQKIITNKMSVKALEDEIALSKPTSDIPTVASQLANEAPIAPTSVEIEEKKDEYGKVTIAPPVGEGNDMANNNDYVNYAEIDKDKLARPKDTYFNNKTVKPVDVNAIKENAASIRKPGSNELSDLDNLLNIDPSTVRPDKDNYLTAPQAIAETNRVSNQPNADYFQMPTSPIDEIAVNPRVASVPAPAESITNIPSSVGITQAPVQQVVQAAPQTVAPAITAGTVGSTTSPFANQVAPITAQAPATYNTGNAIRDIQEVVKKIQEKGINIEINEMDFATAYQVIIKINK